MVPERLESCWLAEPPVRALLPTTRQRALAESKISSTDAPTGMVMVPPVPVIILLVPVPLLLRVTSLVASMLVRVRRWPSRPAAILLKTWAAPEVSNK